ncbi:PepSY-associated TM helix domain-containing protein [Parasphingorhabdus sp.]|uniref:PepSY-associated TM helix domain-containing protein n=1 Tax=Parasphingorhabdus sp. TaxID=2709688 RepID=UPI003A9532CB
MINTIAFIHRWAGGIIGLLLAVIGLTGAFLVWKGAWIGLTVPGAGNAKITDPSMLADVTQNIVERSEQLPAYIIFANDDIPVHIVSTGGKSGFYAGSDGTPLAVWDSFWGRLETLLFEIHHYLLLGDVGTTLTGVAGLIGVGFVITGGILWWRTRSTFKFRIWPARMTRPSIIRQHRDLGAVLTPLLFCTMLTGVMMTLQPVAAVLLMPFSSVEEMKAAQQKPVAVAGPIDNIDWQKIMVTAQARFPDAEFRLVSFPRKPGDPLTIRMKQPDEWHNNGRTMVWFDGTTEGIIGISDALKLPRGSQIYNLSYPVHAAKVGGTVYKVLQTLTGLGLALLGSLAVWSFWFRRKIAKPAKYKPAIS